MLSLSRSKPDRPNRGTWTIRCRPPRIVANNIHPTHGSDQSRRLAWPSDGARSHTRSLPFPMFLCWRPSPHWEVAGARRANSNRRAVEYLQTPLAIAQQTVAHQLLSSLGSVLAGATIDS